MRKIALLVCALMVALVAGCTTAAPTLAPTATAAPKATPTAPVVTPVYSPVATNPPAPIAAAPTATPTLTPTATATPSAPSATVPPGLYVSNLRIDPNPPTRGTELFFYATFLNTTNVAQNYKWIVYIYRPDSPNKSFTQTTATTSTIPVGGGDVKGGGSWKVSLGGPCEDFIARPAFLDQNNQPINFIQPNGKVYEKTFTICAPADLPTGSPAPSPTPTATATFVPGTYAIDLRTDPNPPTRATDLAFYVTFANTTGSPQNVKWNVYIFVPGDAHSTGETTATTTIMGNGINDYRTIGTWNAGPGVCSDYIVRVNWFDNENRLQRFTGFDYQPFEKTITVCPP